MNNLTIEQSKHFIETIYEKGNNIKLENNNKNRAFVARKKALNEIISTPKEEEILNIKPKIEENIKIEEEIQYFIPDLPNPNFQKIILQSPNFPQNNSINDLDSSTIRISYNLDELNEHFSEYLTSLSKIHENSINCYHFSKLNQVLSSSSLKQLTEIQNFNTQKSFFSRFWNYLESFLK